MLAGSGADFEDAAKKTWTRPTAKETNSKLIGSEPLPAVSLPVMTIPHPVGLPGSAGSEFGETLVTTSEPTGSVACKLSAKNWLTQSWVLRWPMSDRMPARLALTRAALEWNATASAICQGPPPEFVVAAVE